MRRLQLFGISSEWEQFSLSLTERWGDKCDAEYSGTKGYS
jgi:hypothetical protein